MDMHHEYHRRFAGAVVDNFVADADLHGWFPSSNRLGTSQIAGEGIDSETLGEWPCPMLAQYWTEGMIRCCSGYGRDRARAPDVSSIHCVMHTSYNEDYRPRRRKDSVLSAKRGFNADALE